MKNRNIRNNYLTILVAMGLLLGSVMPVEVAQAATDDRVMLFPIVKDGKWGYMDKAGNVVIKPEYKLAWDFYEGYACVGVGAFRGFIDKTGKMVFKPTFGWAGKFSEGVALVSLNYKTYGEHVDWYKPKKGWAIISKPGAKPKGVYGRPTNFSDGLAWVAGRAMKYINKEGKPVELEVADEGSKFSDGLAAVRKGKLWGYIDPNMKLAIELKFSAARPFTEGLAAVSTMPIPLKGGDFARWLAKGGSVKWGFIDKTGKMVIEPQFDDTWLFSEGLAPVRIKGKWGFINVSGSLDVHAKYDYAWPFSEGLGRVLKNGKHGFVDKTGKLVIDTKYDVAWEFSKGLARVGVGEKEGYINPKGAFVWEPTE